MEQLIKLKGMVPTGDTTTNNTLIQIGITDTNSNTTIDINDMISTTQQPIVIDITQSDDADND
jgi:hypothetical protein